MNKLNWLKSTYTVFVLCAVTAIALPAQTFTTLHSFDGTDGGGPFAALVQATDGNLYGTTFESGANNNGGTIFKITPNGTLTTLYNFCSQSGCLDGEVPNGLVEATNGNFYGTTVNGGASTGCELGCGTVFKITPGGTLATHSFDVTDGANPFGGLVQATDGNLYGTTESGGATGAGTVFKITPGGALTTLYSFGSQFADGGIPVGALVQASDGNLYGTTAYGGLNNNSLCVGNRGCGTVFRITPSGTLTTLYNFCSQSSCTDGIQPESGLVQATDGNLYGTTISGGAGGFYGTVFKITPSGILTTLYSFCSQSGCTDGANPFAGLVQATDGNFYGLTSGGGPNLFCSDLGGSTNGCGTIFKITPHGTLTTLYSFCSVIFCADGELPRAAPLQDTNGKFYGTTSLGGTNGFGTVFSLSVGILPFVETQPTAGKVGKAVKILGTNLIGATGVTFNGTAVTFTVISRSLITTTVPAGAMTGTVQVVTPHGTLSSNVPFRVLP